MIICVLIVVKFDDFVFQKVNFGGFLMNKCVKNFYVLWICVLEKGVIEFMIFVLCDFGEGNVYDVVVFMLDGNVLEYLFFELWIEVDCLVDRINFCEYGYVYICLELWDGGGLIWILKKLEFWVLSWFDEGVYVILIQCLSGLGEL